MPACRPSTFPLYPSDFGNGIGSGFPTAVWYYSQTQLAAFDSKYTNRDPISRADWTGDYSLKEKDSAAYIQADFDGQGWGGNVGVRFVRTKEDIVSNVGVSASTPGAITTSAFGPYLPTRIQEQLQRRPAECEREVRSAGRPAAAFGRVDDDDAAGLFGTCRADQPDLPPAAPTAATGSGNGSNPNLKPVTSNNFDTSLEWYFAPRSLLSASLFYMDLTSYIGFGHVTQTFKTFNQNYPDGFDAPYVLTVPVNSSGSVKGFELAYEQPFFDNFGIALELHLRRRRGDAAAVRWSARRRTRTTPARYYEERAFQRASFSTPTARASSAAWIGQTAFYQDSIGNSVGIARLQARRHWSFTLDALNLNNPELKYYALNGISRARSTTTAGSTTSPCTSSSDCRRFGSTPQHMDVRTEPARDRFGGVRVAPTLRAKSNLGPLFFTGSDGV